MKTFTLLMLTTLCTAAALGADAPKDGTAAPLQYSEEDFGIGRKHTPNAWCNRQIDKLLEDTRQCVNTHAAGECDTRMKKNSQKMGGYIRSPRCAK